MPSTLTSIIAAAAAFLPFAGAHATGPSDSACGAALSGVRQIVVKADKRARGVRHWEVDDATYDPRTTAQFGDGVTRKAIPTDNITACANVRAYLKTRGIQFGAEARNSAERRAATERWAILKVQVPIVSARGNQAFISFTVSRSTWAYGGSLLLRQTPDGRWKVVEEGGSWIS